jgi:hypothetical protein
LAAIRTDCGSEELRNNTVSRNLAFCSLAIIVFMITMVRSVSSGGCVDPDLFTAWRGAESVPVMAIDPGYWYRASLGWIVAPGECAAREAAVEMEAASIAFERHFGRPAPRGAVVDVVHARHAGALKEAGAAWVLPWRFHQAIDAPRAQAIREQVRSQLAAAGRAPEPEQVEVLVQQALAQLGEPGAPSSPPALAPKAIRHEIAHLLFMQAVWPSSGERPEQYGGDAPDWLDEAAAIIAESEEMTRNRRALFRELAASGGTIPLAEYLEMTHPVYADRQFRAMIDEARAARAEGEPVIIAASLADDRVERARAFYAQTRGFVDYLLERTGDRRVLGDIAVELRDEASGFADWLNRHGAVRGLPAGIEALERDFLEHARET